MSTDAARAQVFSTQTGMRERHTWIVPPFDGPPTGGTCYDAALVAALARRGIACTLLDIETAPSALGSMPDGFVWVDSLFLQQVPALTRATARGQRMGLVLHFLPSFVAAGGPVARARLSDIEQAALANVDAAIVTSETMARWVRALAPGLSLACIEPGTAVMPAVPALSNTPRALVLANVTEGKGILPLLQALAAQVQPGDRFELEVVGSLDRAPAYARACHDVARREPALQGRVRFYGACAHADAMQVLACADVLVSASIMESYGMAVAEARAAGVPVLARDAGHVAAHVASAAGGELVAGHEELAARLLALARDPTELSRRKQLAQRRTVVRSWDDAARDFIDIVNRLGLA